MFVDFVLHIIMQLMIVLELMPIGDLKKYLVDLQNK